MFLKEKPSEPLFGWVEKYRDWDGSILLYGLSLSAFAREIGKRPRLLMISLLSLSGSLARISSGVTPSARNSSLSASSSAWSPAAKHGGGGCGLVSESGLFMRVCSSLDGDLAAGSIISILMTFTSRRSSKKLGFSSLRPRSNSRSS